MENYTKQHSDQLKRGNPFIAHRGLLGVSRDLIDLDSYNAQQAKLIWDYFGMVNDISEIDVLDMYRMFVLGWNAELAEDNPFRKDFKDSSAQLFVLLMDTLDVLMGKADVGDGSLLLNDDRKIWGMLADAKCWGDMEKIM